MKFKDMEFKNCEVSNDEADLGEALTELSCWG